VNLPRVFQRRRRVVTRPEPVCPCGAACQCDACKGKGPDARWPGEPCGGKKHLAVEAMAEHSAYWYHHVGWREWRSQSNGPVEPQPRGG
jgi:hypothetical protein